LLCVRQDLVFIAKNHGKGSWTDGLATLAEKGCGQLLTQLPPSPSSIYRITIGAGDPIGRYHPVLLDGPYGDVGVDLQWSTRLMLVAGGAGMSVVSALLSHMSAMRRSRDESGKLGVEYLTLVWVVRDPDVILAFAPTLQVSCLGVLGSCLCGVLTVLLEVHTSHSCHHSPLSFLPALSRSH
jgi:hypothetical protein